MVERRSVFVRRRRGTNRAARDMEYKTVHTAQKRIRMDGKQIDMDSVRTDANQKMIGFDWKTVTTSHSRIISGRKPIHMD